MKILHDVEIFPDFFCTTVYDYDTDEKIIFEISERKNQLLELVKFYKSIKGFLISFNGVHYDTPMIKYILLNYQKWKNVKPFDITFELQEFSNTIINTDFWWKDKHLKKYKYNHLWIDLDLYLFWARMTRMNKKISLKSLGIQLGYPIVQELPFVPNKPLETSENMDKIIEYNSIHDINLLKWLLEKPIKWQGKKSSFKQMVNLRKNIRKKYKLPKSIYHWDSTKIATELLSKFLTNKFGNDNFKNQKTNHYGIDLKDIIIPNLFYLDKKEDFFIRKKKKSNSVKKVCLNLKTLVNELRQKTVHTTKEISYSVQFTNPDYSTLLCDVGSGGLHGIIADKVIEADNKYEILDFDIGLLAQLKPC